MPPRKRMVVAQDPQRADILREYATSEREINELKALEVDDALWRIGHERDQLIAWAKRKADFLTNEVRASRRVPRGQGGTVEFVQPRPDRFEIGGTRLG